MSREDPFEEIVRHLDLELSFPEHAPEPEPEPESEPAPKRSAPGEPDDAFYRAVEPRTPRPARLGHLLAWLGVIAGPATIVIASAAFVILPRPILLGIALLFVASAVYLIAQLPDRGPAEPNWPDDGAQL